MKKESKLRSIPAVEKILQALGETGLPRPVVTALVRRQLAALRGAASIPEFETVVAGMREALRVLRLSRIQPVINGTGIVIHTNLGRAPLGAPVLNTLLEIGANYNNLEYDLAAGERGGRATYLEHALAQLCGAEAATVTNNCAAALVLILRHFTSGERKEVVISRGELVQIGGGFRIPEILEASGAKLREVGTTNKTTIRDYERVLGSGTALILKVHRSNFFMGGFVESPATEEIVALARRRRLPCVEDLGSGAMVATEQWPGLEHEPTPAEVLKRGVDVVCFSGDKLLGGPQAGLIAGKMKRIKALKQEPFFRALRCDKLILGALQTTVETYLGATGSAVKTSDGAIPILEMLSTSTEGLRVRAEKLVSALAGLPLKARVGTGTAQPGGGTMPKSGIPSVTLDLIPSTMTLADFGARLRAGKMPVIGYISGHCFKLDLRTVFPRQDDVLIPALAAVFERKLS